MISAYLMDMFFRVIPMQIKNPETKNQGYHVCLLLGVYTNELN